MAYETGDYIQVQHSSTHRQYSKDYRIDTASPMAQKTLQGSSTASGSESSNTTYGSSASNGFVHMSEVSNDPQPWSQAAVTAPLGLEVASKKSNLYPCLVPGCQPKTKKGAFTRAADLDRHMQTVHNAAPTNNLDRPYAKNWCERTGSRGFSRKDHLNEHSRQVHPGRPVVRQEKADAFTRAADLDRHMQTVQDAVPAILDCLYAKYWYERTGERGFTREDHLNEHDHEHIRQVHSTLVLVQ